MEIVPGIHLADKGYSNTYLLVRKNKLMLIDSGMDKNPTKILAYIKKLKHRPEEIDYILITHSHLDHIRGLKKIKELCNAKVAVHKTEADIVAGKKPMILPKGFLGFFFRIMMPFMGYKPVKPDIMLDDGKDIEGLKVIHTPGHTPGSVCFYDQKKRVMFTGDTIILDKGKLSYVKSNFNVDEELMKSSSKKISKIKFDFMLPGHGGVIKSGASEKLKKFLERNP